MNRLVRHLMLWWLLAAVPAALAVTVREPPQGMLQEVSQAMFSTLKAERERLRQHPEAIYGLVEQSLLPHVDFPLISQLVLGKHWRTASPAQRERFMEEFRQLLVRFYVGAFVEDPRKLDELLADTDHLIRFEPADPAAEAVNRSVRSEVHLPTGRVVVVSFSVHHKGEAWKVYDVTVEGVSLVTNYRSSFSTEIRQGGLDALIERLATRNQELLAATPANR